MTNTPIDVGLWLMVQQQILQRLTESNLKALRNAIVHGQGVDSRILTELLHGNEGFAQIREAMEQVAETIETREALEQLAIVSLLTHPALTALAEQGNAPDVDTASDTISPHITTTPDIAGGKPRIAGHRITIQNVAIWHERMGMSVDEIATEYGLTLAQVYAALSYYHDHREEIEASIRADKAFVEEMNQQHPSQIAERLAGRRGG